MNFTQLFAVVFISVTSFVMTPIDGVVLEKHQKVESTFSGNLGDSSDSFHIIITKNSKTKKFDVVPVLYKDKELKQLNAIEFDKKPSVLSFHSSNNNLSIITTKQGKKNKFINVVDVDLESGVSLVSKNINAKEFKTVLREKDKSYLLFANSGFIKVTEIKSGSETKTITAKAASGSRSFLDGVKDNSIKGVNSNEFVSNGPISKFRAYNTEQGVVITKEDSKTGTTSVAVIPVNDEERIEFKSKTYKTNLKAKAKKSTSYVKANKLVQLTLNKEEGAIGVNALDSDESLELNLAEADITRASKGFKGLQDFLKKSSKSANEPTITLNTTKSGKLLLRADYVNKNVYRYHFDWWWHHQMMMQNMQWQMQNHLNQVKNNLPKFGPNEDGYNSEHMLISKEERHYFELVLDIDNTLSKETEIETEHQDIDKKIYVDNLDNNRKLKHASSVFVSGKFRYFAFDKKQKTFVVKEETVE